MHATIHAAALASVVALAGCGGRAAGLPRSDDGGGDSSSVDTDVALDAAGPDGGTCLDEPPFISGGGCWCDPSNPCQPCCPAMLDAAACFISESNYDTSCSVDSDCIAAVGANIVQFGNWCVSECFCGGGAINKDSAAQYAQDVERTPLGSGAVSPGACGCPASFGPCCLQGQCTFTGCGATPIPIDASAEVDASPEPGNIDYTVLCVGDAGPVDASLADTPAVSGVSRWCNGPEVCTSFNGGWACCTLDVGPVAMCIVP
jgi:hypothetical protein